MLGPAASASAGDARATRIVVVVEYLGEDLPRGGSGLRRPVLEHAYDLGAQRLAGLHVHRPRIGFPTPHRGWPVVSPLRRCLLCSHAVTGRVGKFVGELLERTSRDWAILVQRERDMDPVWLHLPAGDPADPGRPGTGDTHG